MNRDRKLALLVVLTVALAGCETVANVAQGVADSARGPKKPDSAEPSSASATAAPTNALPCESNFVVEGNVITGKLFKSKAPIAKLNPDAAYKKTLGEIAKRGWQITSSDKDSKIIMASQAVNLSSSGRGTPMSFLIGSSPGGASDLQLTYTMPGGVFISESAVKDLFCKFVADVSSGL